MSRRPVVAVVGGGFSGLLTTLHLLADPEGPQVRLLERRGVFGRGLAYATDNPDHLLNVRIGNMSAFPDQPDHFLRWLATHSGWRAHGGFVTRGVYGDYLQSLLRDAVGGAFGADRLLLEADEVVRLKRVGAGWRVGLAMGHSFTADAVVLAVGALPTAAPAAADADLLASAHYIGDPWRALRPDARVGEHVLLLGTGLTMVDVALSLSQPGRRLTAISRRGLEPRVHDVGPPAPGRTDLAGRPLAMLRQARRLAEGRPWQAAVDEIRGSVSRLWMSWSQVERRRFLRHVRPWWDVHRHRMAPPVARRIDEMRRTGELQIRAGAIERLSLQRDHALATWRPRGTARSKATKVDTIINCTGFQGDLQLSGERLFDDLLAGHLIRPDPCGLGADVDARSRPLNRWGAVTPGFYAVGPLTRGAFWEMTSAPDIRRQALDVAEAILGELSRATDASALSAAGAERQLQQEVTPFGDSC